MDIAKDCFSYIKRLFIVFLLSALAYNIPFFIIEHFSDENTIIRMNALRILSIIEIPVVIGLLIFLGKYMVNKAYINTPTSANEKLVATIVSISIVIMSVISFWNLFNMTVELVKSRDYIVNTSKQGVIGYENARDNVANNDEERAYYQLGVDTFKGIVDTYDPTMIISIILAVIVVISTAILIFFVIKKL